VFYIIIYRAGRTCIGKVYLAVTTDTSHLCRC